MLRERRAAGEVVGVEHVGLHTCLTRESLLREMLIVHQVWVAGVFPTLWQRNSVLQEREEEESEGLVGVFQLCVHHCD